MKKSLSTLALVLLVISAGLDSRSPVLGQGGGVGPATETDVVEEIHMPALSDEVPSNSGQTAKATDVLKCCDSADFIKSWKIDKVILYPTGKGGRVYLESRKGDQLTITLCFRQDQWVGLSLGSRDLDLKKLLDVRYEGSNPVIASDTFEYSLSSMPELPTDVRLITVKITFRRKLEGGSADPFKWSYRFPSGGWSSSFLFQLPSPDSQEQPGTLAYTSELKIINQSGIDWSRGDIRELYAKPDVESKVIKDFDQFKRP